MNKELQAQLWAQDIKKDKGVNVFSNTRRRDVVTYRALHVHLLKNNLKWTLYRIKDFYEANGKPYDHTTVLHALNMFEIYARYDRNIMVQLAVLGGNMDDNVGKHEMLKAKLNYVDPSLYDRVDETLNELMEDTAKINEEELKRSKLEKNVA